MGFPTKVQLIQRKDSQQWYINFPSAVAQAMEFQRGEIVEWIVEDNGAGPPAGLRDHLFDPFYSGRQAGRGRGLGLATAWRMAKEHGGDVRFEEVPSGPTRFVLSLPWEGATGVTVREDKPESAGFVVGSVANGRHDTNGTNRASRSLDA